MLKCWSHPCWVGMVCIGSLASSDALWDIGQYAKIAALLLFLWLQHPKVVFLSSYLPDRDFSASPVHLDGAISSYGSNKLYFTAVAYYHPCSRWFCHCYLISSFLFFHEDPKALRFSYWFQPSHRIQMCQNFNLLKSAKTEWKFSVSFVIRKEEFPTSVPKSCDNEMDHWEVYIPPSALSSTSKPC